MKDIRAFFLEKIDRTETVSSFRFLSQDGLDFCAGQFIQVVFDPQDPLNKQMRKYLSFSSRPRKDFFELTKRRSDSAFSTKLWSLKKSDEVLFKGPMGTCIFDRAFKKIGFLIGGIGITPVISMLDHIFFNNLEVDVCLIYSNLREKDMPFCSEIDCWAKTNKNFRVVYTIVDQEPQNKNYHKGMITADMVCNEIPDFRERVFFISGPPQMVQDIKSICEDIGCDMGKVQTENFVGY